MIFDLFGKNNQETILHMNTIQEHFPYPKLGEVVLHSPN